MHDRVWLEGDTVFDACITSKPTPWHRRYWVAVASALAVVIDPRTTPRKACRFCFFIGIESAKDSRHPYDFSVAHDCATSCEPFRLQNVFPLQDGMAPQCVPAIFLSLHLLTSEGLPYRFLSVIASALAARQVLLLERLGVDSGRVQRSINHRQFLGEIKRPFLAVASDGHAVVHRNQLTVLAQGID